MDTSPENPLAGVADVPAGEWLDAAIQTLARLGVPDLKLHHSERTKTMVATVALNGEWVDCAEFAEIDARTILGKLKTAAGLDTSGSAATDQGSYELLIDEQLYTVRLVLLPTFDGGQTVVMRMPTTGPVKYLGELGFSEDNLARFKRLLDMPSGLILLAGPMGEGKTTTSHAALLHAAEGNKSVMSIEDPVERYLPGFVQMQINDRAGVSFRDLSRDLVRAAFDVLFIGEVRDAETAASAVRMAKIGRKVLTTIHAKNNVTAVLRLIELAEDSPLGVLESVTGIISQRLVFTVDPVTGKRNGRKPVHEVLEMTEKLQQVVMDGTSLKAIRDVAAKSSSTFESDARALLESGVTSAEEIHKVIGQWIELPSVDSTPTAPEPPAPAVPTLPTASARPPQPEVAPASGDIDPLSDDFFNTPEAADPPPPPITRQQLRQQKDED